MLEKSLFFQGNFSLQNSLDCDSPHSISGFSRLVVTKEQYDVWQDCMIFLFQDDLDLGPASAHLFVQGVQYLYSIVQFLYHM